MADFAVWIRTHYSRLDLAFQLKDTAFSFLSNDVSVLNTGATDPLYSEKFIMALDAHVRCASAPYILLLEDDIAFSADAQGVIRLALQAELPHVWFTLPNVEALTSSVPLWGPFRRIHIVNNFYYSGAVLLRTKSLRDFLLEYLLDHTQLDVPNFDVNLSRFLLRDAPGGLFLAPGYFGSDPSVPSSISFDAGNAHPSRTLERSTLDPLFSYEKSVHTHPRKVVASACV